MGNISQRRNFTLPTLLLLVAAVGVVCGLLRFGIVSRSISALVCGVLAVGALVGSLLGFFSAGRGGVLPGAVIGAIVTLLIGALLNIFLPGVE